MIYKKQDQQKISSEILDFTTDASGDATVDFSGYGGYEIISVESIPGLLGDKVTTCPTSVYTLTLEDSYNFDWLYAEGADRSISLAEAFCQDSVIPLHNTLTLVVNGAAEVFAGRVIIWMR